MKSNGTRKGAVEQLAVVLVLVVVLVVILILVIVLVAILIVVLIAVLVIHNRSSENLYLRQYRSHSVSVFSAFILCFENQACQKSGCDRSGNAARTGFQTAGKYAGKTILRNGFLNALGKIITESGQGNTCTGTRKLRQGLINADCTEKDTDDDVADQNPGRFQLCFIDQNLSDQTQSTTHKKSFDIIHVNPSR